MTDGAVLLAEDSRDDQQLILRSLKKSKIANNVVIANDGVEALDYLFCTGPHEGKEIPLPVVILLDIKMPRIDGLEVLKRVRSNERTRHIPVVILTSSTEEQDIVASYNLGVNSYVPKPVDFAEFSAAVVDIGLYWLITNVPPPLEAA